MQLKLENITKKFDKKTIVDEASFTFEKGKIYGLLGRNGAGKTTLFNCIAKNMQVDSGVISLAGVGEVNENYDNTDIGLVYDTPHLPGFMTGFEFVKFFIDINKERMNDPQAPEYYLNLVGIKRADQHLLLKDYSHGMKNKVQMVASMMVRPAVILLDEPLTSFDVVAAHEMKELILSAKADSVIIFSTHILQLAQDLCDEIVLLHNHRLQGIPAEKIHDQDFEMEIVSLLTEEETETRDPSKPRLLMDEEGE